MLLPLAAAHAAADPAPPAAAPTGAPAAAAPADDDDDLADIEAALAEDAKATEDAKAAAADDATAADAATDGAAADGAAADFDHDHAAHHTGKRLDIDRPDEAPTWKQFVDNWQLFRDPVFAGMLAGLVLGFLSVYVVLRRMVFVSAAVTQAAGFGVAGSFYAAAKFGVSFDPVWGATAMSLLTAALVAPDPKRLGLSREAVLGLCFALFAGGAVLTSSKIPQEAHDVQAILFGTAVVVSRDDMHRLALSGGLVLALQLWWFRGFSFASFDPLAARVQGLPVRLLDVLLLLCIGVMVGEAARALGALPAFALSTLPGVAAVQLARGPLVVPFVGAAVLGAAAGGLGYIVAFFYELPVGATQTALAALFVVAATLLRVGGHALARALKR